MSTQMEGIDQASLFSHLLQMRIEVSAQSQYRILAEALPWIKIAEVANSCRTKNVDIHNGRPLNLRAHLGAYICQSLYNWTDRETEEMVRYHAGVRVLCGLQESSQTLDHTTVEKFRNALGKEGSERINKIIIEVACKHGFTGSGLCSSDTTVQEAPIAHPTEAGHLRKIAQKLTGISKKIGKKIKKNVTKKVVKLQSKVEEIFTEIRLFTRGKSEQAKQKRIELTRMLHQTVENIQRNIEEMLASASFSVRAKYAENVELYRKIIEQIKVWIGTGHHCAGKIVSLWNTEARAIVRNKASKMVEFGRRWIITRLVGGYIIGMPCEKLGSDADTSIAMEVLDLSIDVFGKNPKMFVYDRGGDGSKNHEVLKEAGIKYNCIFRKGNSKMQVEPRIFKLAKRERALSEASIATLKSAKYGFTKPRARTPEGCYLKGQKAILGANLNRFFRDIIKVQGLALDIG